MKKDNSVAQCLFYIGVVVLSLGIIIGYFLGKLSYDGFSWMTFLSYSFGGFITGMLFIGFSEVIRLLNNIDNKMKGIQRGNIDEIKRGNRN